MFEEITRVTVTCDRCKIRKAIVGNDPDYPCIDWNADDAMCAEEAAAQILEKLDWQYNVDEYEMYCPDCSDEYTYQKDKSDG